LKVAILMDGNFFSVSSNDSAQKSEFFNSDFFIIILT
jgi:hypothetical protein